MSYKPCFATGVYPPAVSRPRIAGTPSAAGTKRTDDLFGALWPAVPPDARNEASPSEKRPPRPEARNNACPVARVKRAFPDRLPASPVFTGTPDPPICQPSVYAGSRPACLLAQYLQGIQTCLSASPVFTWDSGLPIRKPSIYGHPRFTCLQAPCLRALPA